MDGPFRSIREERWGRGLLPVPAGVRAETERKEIAGSDDPAGDRRIVIQDFALSITGELDLPFLADIPDIIACKTAFSVQTQRIGGIVKIA